MRVRRKTPEVRTLIPSLLCRVFEGAVPPHFYGEMAKTELGCQVLSDKGHFAEFAHFIRQHGLESEDQDVIVKLKSVLWAVVRFWETAPSRGLKSHSFRAGQHRGARWRLALLGG